MACGARTLESRRHTGGRANSFLASLHIVSGVQLDTQGKVALPLSSVLPPAPPGQNVLRYTADAIESWMYGGKATPGFHARLIVLLSLLGFVTLSGLVAIALHAAARKRAGRSVWIVRRVSVGHTTVVVFDHFALLFLFNVLLPAVGLLQIITSTRVYLDHASQATLGGYRLAGYIPLFVSAWFIAWSSLVNYLVALRDKAPRFLNGHVLNGLSFGLGFALSATLIALVTVGGIRSNNMWKAYLVLQRDFNQAADLLDQGLLDGATLHAVEATYINWRCVRQDYYQIFICILASCVAVALIITAIHSLTFALVLVIRRQINESVAHIAGKSVAPVSPALPAVTSDPTLDHALVETSSGRRGSGQSAQSIDCVPVSNSLVTNAQIRRAARGHDVEGLEQEQAQRLVDLKRVEFERILVSPVARYLWTLG